jgi:hypothetical protein
MTVMKKFQFTILINIFILKLNMNKLTQRIIAHAMVPIILLSIFYMLIRKINPPFFPHVFWVTPIMYIIATAIHNKIERFFLNK